MSAAQQTEWLNLIEKSGPFLAPGVLAETFPQGLEKIETRARQRIRSAYEEWREAVDAADPSLDALHAEWVRLVLEELLAYEPSVLKGGSDIPSRFVFVEPHTGCRMEPSHAVLINDSEARLLIKVCPPDTALSRPLPGETWAASPIERMTQLCKATGVPVGLVTDGEQWALVSSPPDGASSHGIWFSRIWQQEPITLQAFVSLLDVRRCFGAAEGTPQALFAASLEHQNEVTDILGEQVRRAIEVLVQALDKADLDRDRELLKSVSPSELYEAGLTVMMRLVVLLCAEERGLLLLDDPTYRQSYAASTLRAQLKEEHRLWGGEILEHRHDAWARLLALFRGVFGGIEHESLRLPPLGGSLFDPDRFPFLEGRPAGSCWRDVPATPLPIDNRTVLLLLSALQVLEKNTGAIHLSYELLDVEQIGHVYEGLLERAVRRVPETTLGLLGSQKAVNPNATIRELEEAQASGQDKLLSLLVEKTGRSESALRKALVKRVDDDLQHAILAACGGDSTLACRITPWALLLRKDAWGEPVIYRESSFQVGFGTSRRETGAHYTPKILTEPIVQHTLEPLVYEGPAEGVPIANWKLKSPSEILALKVCDMAMGSAAFLVQVCRYLGERLVEAWDIAVRSGKFVSIDGKDLDLPGDCELLPKDASERQLIARRLVSSSCIYGVDFNPMAVELAKVSLWLVTMQKNKPFTFLDHALKCGDSLLGVSSLDQVEIFSLRSGERQVTFATANLFRYVEQAGQKRRELEDLPSNDHTQIETKNRLHAEAEAATAKVKALADCLIALELRGLDGDAYADARETEADQVQRLLKQDADAALKTPITNPPSALAAHAKEQLRGRRPFHWPLEYPEIFSVGGFSLVVGNPPFISYYSRQSLKEEVDFAQSLALSYQFSQVSSAGRRFNSAMFFWERALTVATNGGVVGLLNDMNLLENSFVPIREWICANYRPTLLVHRIRAFAHVASGQAFLVVWKTASSPGYVLSIRDGFDGASNIVRFNSINAANGYSFIPVATEHTLSGIPAGELLKISVGVVFSGATDRFLTAIPSGPFSKPYMAPGGLRERFQNPLPVSHYITFSSDLCEKVNTDFKLAGKKNVVVLGRYERFSDHKIVLRQSAPALIATIDNTGIVFPLNYFAIGVRAGLNYDLFYFLAVLNSETLSAFARDTGIIRMAPGKQPQIRKSGLDSLPIPTPRNFALVEKAANLARRIWGNSSTGERNRLLADLETVVKDCYADHSPSVS